MSEKQWHPRSIDGRVWGLGVIVGKPVKTVVRPEDRPRIRETLARVAEYHRKHPEK